MGARSKVLVILAGVQWKGFAKLPEGPHETGWPAWPVRGWDLQAGEPMRIVGGEPIEERRR